MGLIHKDIFVCLDCESTGLDPQTDRLIEVAAKKFTFEEVLQEFETLVNPECDIPQISQDIHNISKEMLEGKPKAIDILPELLKMIDGHILVGHGIGFDIALIAAEAKRCQIPNKIEKQPFLDTLRMARLYGESPINSLERLRQHFNIQAEGAHRAMNDVTVNIEVFKFLSKSYKTTEQLFKILEKPIKLKMMPLGKHKGRRFDEIPLEYLLWAERKNFDQDLLYSIRSELRNRKKGNGFEQNCSPFSSL
ncbi:MAG: DNA polymerase III subunit epsilon [Chlamydiae bacterium CG10_big_fil_rev_8_21_14_0_10_42_34]|nr:MAG: DNA polymerase III subunit epsilon [Chlamydiae bacterium CG10_big_fil_rev_8_21_14_0_10_42_34]